LSTGCFTDVRKKIKLRNYVIALPNKLDVEFALFCFLYMYKCMGWFMITKAFAVFWGKGKDRNNSLIMVWEYIAIGLHRVVYKSV